jgi:hypothetical protein
VGLKSIVDSAGDAPQLDDINTLVTEYAKAWWAEKDAKAKKEAVKKRILALHKRNGIDSLDGPEGEILIVHAKDSTGLVTKMVKDILTEDQIKQCTGVTRKGGIRVDFKPAVKRPE